MQQFFGKTALEMSKEDMKKDPKAPVIRLYDDEELIGIFSLKTLEPVYDNGMADYDVQFAQKEIALNQENWLETWRDYVGILNA